MNLFETEYRTGEFAQLVDTTPEILRDWRRRGFDVGVGVSVNGQKGYFDYDRLEMRVVAQLRHDGMDSISDAFSAARHVTPAIAKQLGYDLSGSPADWMKTADLGFHCRFALISSKHDYTYTDDLNRFIERDIMASYMKPFFTVIDIHSLIEKVREWAASQLPIAEKIGS